MKKVIISAVLATLLGGGLLYAKGAMGEGFEGCGKKSPETTCQSNTKGGMCDKGRKGDMRGGDMMSMHAIMSLLRDMELDKEQEKALRKVMFENREAMLEKSETKNPPSLSLDKNGNFDKKSFIKTAKAEQEEMLAMHADFLEKIFSILTSEQKKGLADKISNNKI